MRGTSTNTKDFPMNKTETKNSTTKRLTLTRRTLRTVTTDELRLVAGGRSSLATSPRKGTATNETAREVYIP